MTKLFRVLYLFILVLHLPAEASDFAKEKRWSDQIVDSLMVGETEWLRAGDHKFLALYTESLNKEVHGAVIVVHGSGVHPNWSEVVFPLRTALPEAGWTTLSIQMPILANDADIKEYAPLMKEVAPRLQAAVAYLQDKGIDNIIIVAHSLGSVMSAYYLAHHENNGIRAFVAIGAPGKTFSDDSLNYLTSLHLIKIPVLDLYGSKDLDSVTSAVTAKNKSAASNKAYQQKVVEGADHFFVGKEVQLVKQVTEFIQRY